MSRRKRKAESPVRSALVPGSTLLPLVQNGLGAVEAEHRRHIEEALRPAFDDSVDIDDGLRPGREAENRWDYLLGVGADRTIIALEPHSAKSGEVDTVIRKKRAARDQLRPHLRPEARVRHWFWVASGEVQFASTERAILRLAQEGIVFVGRVLRAKHLFLSNT